MNKMRGFELVKEYDGKLPVIANIGDGGADFYTAERVVLRPGTINNLIPTGVKAYMNDGEVLLLFARSSMAKKYGLRMSNSVAVIDKGFYNNKSNEGHITFLYDNITDKEVIIEKHTRIGQGIFMQFLPIDNIEVLSQERTGGYGSSGNK